MKNLSKLAGAATRAVNQNSEDGNVRNVKELERGSNAARSLGHRLNMLTSIMMSVGTGNPEDMEIHSAYWDSVVELVSNELQKWYPERRGELRADEIGTLQNATRLIARDGVRSGLSPEEFMAPFLKAPFLDPSRATFTSNPQQTESVYMLFSNLKGIEKVSKSIGSMLRELEKISDTKLERLGVSREVLRELVMSDLSSEDLARHVYAQIRLQVQVVVKHLADSYTDPTIANQATVSNLASSATDHIESKVRFGFNEFLLSTLSKWGDPMKQSEIMERGALALWMKDEVDHFCNRTITIVDSYEDYLVEGLKMTNPELLAKTERFDAALKSPAFEDLLTRDEPEPEVIAADEVTTNKGSFADRLKSSGIKLKSSAEEPADKGKQILDGPAPQ